MKLARLGPPGAEKPALIEAGGRARDLSGIVPDITAEALGSGLLQRLAALDPSALPYLPDGERFGPPVRGVGKFLCVGLNYRDHAAESGIAIPEEPVLFMKATSAICGANDAIVIPRGSLKTDWEVELGVVIGRTARDIPVETALAHVAGYLLVNDLSERAFQLERGGQWVKGKSCDTFGPIGPFLVTTEEIPDPQALSLWLEVNGTRRQNGHTSDMVFDVAFLISYISRFMTLCPGDIISTGTPAGVGLGLRPPVYLGPGDRMVLGIDGEAGVSLGCQTQICRAWAQ
ncbi:fumarylacetoacetate hydrolase family protein [Swaminathania salitolerans]|uniref:2-hydroxyhepta-2,4-diene-1,7-dioate isomerase n=1 Tax=Swaminathania salitolerans TaxID=182838 RepID=A0A511BLK0_9PROT|nr:fumarylacetoacetate hydrolase family protein [Swaminathania salitolerans]GBQ10230.1 2-keto-4-pentenoate hydratase [Swaminathania salitolerans LMG 21291]GEL01219.1 2-hydroxyhepta-2,4-diene-1,7-dioate isomerase [Swaminathania salitolerans]